MRLRPPRWLLVVLAFVLFGQSALAAAHCLRLAASPQHAPFHVEICTGDGIVLMDLGGTGQEIPAGPAHAGFCLACHGLPHLVMPEPASVPVPAVHPVAAFHTAPEAAPPLGARAPPYTSRAPPALS